MGRCCAVCCLLIVSTSTFGCQSHIWCLYWAKLLIFQGDLHKMTKVNILLVLLTLSCKNRIIGIPKDNDSNSICSCFPRYNKSRVEVQQSPLFCFSFLAAVQTELNTQDTVSLVQDSLERRFPAGNWFYGMFTGKANQSSLISGWQCLFSPWWPSVSSCCVICDQIFSPFWSWMWIYWKVQSAPSNTWMDKPSWKPDSFGCDSDGRSPGGFKDRAPEFHPGLGLGRSATQILWKDIGFYHMIPPVKPRRQRSELHIPLDLHTCHCWQRRVGRSRSPEITSVFLCHWASSRSSKEANRRPSQTLADWHVRHGRLRLTHSTQLKSPLSAACLSFTWFLIRNTSFCAGSHVQLFL